MIIKVTQSHIDRGCRGDGQRCPVALAVAEAVNAEVTVENDFISFVDDYGLHRIPTPKVVVKFIFDYDVGKPDLKPVEPFEFDLDVEGTEV